MVKANNRIGYYHYHLGGMLQPGRQFNAADYRFGFNGQEKVNEITGVGNHNTALFWEYDTRLVRRWNLDPKPNPSISSYSAFANNPIFYSDVNGDTVTFLLDKQGAGGNGHMGMLYQGTDNTWY